jgi:hypothetical protein
MLKTLKLFARHHFTDRPFDGPEPEPHFKIERLNFNLEKLNDQLKSLGAKLLTNDVEYRNKKYPVYCLDFLSKKPNAKKLFVLAGTHGNEQGGLLGAQQIIDYLIANGVPDSVSVRIVAAHNPVGCDYFSRYNADGIDVNRDFKRQRTIETQVAAKAFDEFNPDFGISLHEGPQNGAFLYTNKYCRDTTVKNVLSELSQAGIYLSTKSYLRNTLSQPGWFPVKGIFGGLLKTWARAFGYEGFGQFCTRKHVPGIVIETSWSIKEETQRTKAHYTLFTALLKELDRNAVS